MRVMRARDLQEHYLRVKDVAARWDVSQRHVRRMIASGELPVHRMGRSVRIAFTAVLMAEVLCRGAKADR
jgi:excisionase family DNA binding protein